MRRILSAKIAAAIQRAREAKVLDGNGQINGLTVEVPKTAGFGDWSTNAALIMAKAEKKAPRDIARILIDHLEDPEGYIEKIEIAGPGFINFILSHKWWLEVVRTICQEGKAYGQVNLGQGLEVQVEFVSANPTGPLHVGHGRGAAVGDALARLLTAAGYHVSREYYINDAGRQMQTLGRSVLYRYLELYGREVAYPADHYQGVYIKDLAIELQDRDQDIWLNHPEEEAVAVIFPWAAGRILEGIKKDLAAFRVTFDHWFSESSLYTNGLVDQTLTDLSARGHIYNQDGALWFATKQFGDDKDRVLIKSSGEKTYFASDIAYHWEKFQRGLDRVIDLWGADHHGYVPRMMAAVQALGHRPDQLTILLVQLVNLLRDGVPVAMSTRAGEFVTLKEVVDEVGVDAARFLFLTRGSDSSLDFDLEAAKRQSADNPVYYVQYAHARIANVFVTARDRGLEMPDPQGADLTLLSLEEELSIMKHLAAFPDTIEGAARNLEPHRLTHYLTELAKKFHPYYNKHRFVSDDHALTMARLVLARAVQQVTVNGLTLLGVDHPDRM